jgi:hypothetical protein
MLHTYRATLRGDRLEWDDTRPEHLSAEEGVPVHVTILDESTNRSGRELQSEKMAAALNRLAQIVRPTIKDPVSWQREQRHDRDLPSRS